ncbi:MAG TPA: hypothetical protein VHE35_27740 [Kofleriaceae bacterium]|nr:hypothetical protein [Kofleriaceae bacterium]
MTKLGVAILAWVTGAAVGCGGGTAHPAVVANNSGGGELSLGGQLVRDVGAGAAVAIVPGPDGLRAISADGARQKVLVPGPVPWALVDNRGDVVWYGTGDAAAIQVLDLESSATTPMTKTVVTGLPTDTDAGAPMVTIAYPIPGDDHGMSEELTAGHPITPHIVLTVSDAPSLSGSGGILELWDQQEQWEAAVEQGQIADGPLLAKIAARAKGRSLGAAPSTAQHRVELQDTSNCEDSDTCGTAEEVTPKLWRVATSYSCGDGCYTEWQLYDPAAKQFVDTDWAKLIEDAWIAPDASAFVTAGRIIRFDSGPVAATPAVDDGAAVGGGWLGGGTYIF